MADDVERQQAASGSSRLPEGAPSASLRTPSKSTSSRGSKNRFQLARPRFGIGLAQKSFGTRDGLPRHRQTVQSTKTQPAIPTTEKPAGHDVHRSASMPAADELATQATTPPAIPDVGLNPPKKSVTTSPLVSPSTPDAYTIFNKLDRPELETMDSYVVGARSPILSPSGVKLSNIPRPSLPNLSLPPMPSILPGKKARQDTDGGTTSLPPSQKPSGNKTTSGAAARAEDVPIVTSVAGRQRPASPEEGDSSAGHGEVDATQEGAVNEEPVSQRLADLHEKFPYLKNLPKPILPLGVFPGQGAGQSSEFAQEAPLWSRQPYKILYLVYFGLSIGLIFLPWFAFISLFPSKRPRQSWSWKRSTLVKLYRHGTRLTFRTHTQLSRDLTEEVPHSKTVRGKFVWVDALQDDLIRGELRRMMRIQGLSPRRTCGFWYGERDGGGGVGQQALPGEKVVYHLHGGAYWIGTAHEKDVTAAVNMQALAALDRIYRERASRARGDEKPREPCKRTFSVDYRLCVPGRPEAGSFPAPLLDALAGYRYLVRTLGFAPENIIVAGDSAGGNLGLALCRYLRDEGIDGMPGGLILLSPWADTSRSHSGPTGSTNTFSSVWTNRNSDIISPSLAFRNTAVSALLGKMEARETYKNPYLSSCSLQLDAKDGGSGPSWGYEGFPKRIYLCTGTAEISHDQHLTLAYRLAGGSQRRVPVHIEGSDPSCMDLDPFETAARLNYPRPSEYTIALWPSAQNTPQDTPIGPPQDGFTELQHESSRMSQSNDEGRPVLEAADVGSNGPDRGKGTDSADQDVMPTIIEPHGDIDGIPDTNGEISHQPSSGVPSPAELSEQEAGSGKKTMKVKEKDTDALGNVTNTAYYKDADAEEGQGRLGVPIGAKQSRRSTMTKSSSGASVNSRAPSQTKLPNGDRVYTGNGSQSDVASSIGLLRNGAMATPRPAGTPGFATSLDIQPLTANDQHSFNGVPSPAARSEYFAVGGEDRIVTLDVCKDAVHDYTLFDWFEPERGQTWARIAQWIDEQT